MFSSLILAVAVGLPTAGDPGSEAELPFARQSRAFVVPVGAPHFEPADEWIVRGQTPIETTPALTVPLDGSTTYYQPGTTVPNAVPYQGTPGLPYQATPGDPFSSTYPAPITQDPWLGAGAVPPYAAPVPGYGTGVNGPRPQRFGWQARYDFEFLPSAKTNDPNGGDFSVFGLNVEKIFTTPLVENWVFAAAPQFNYRAYEGPLGLGLGNDLPGSVYRFGLGLKLQTPVISGWSWEFGFTPAIASDFNRSLTGDGWLFDGHLVLYWTMDPRMTWAFGVQYWDRVDNIVIPRAGLIWTPDQFWELQLLFPKSRISLFLGAPAGIATWAYTSGEYHVEAYQVEVLAGHSEARAQIADWRIMGGLRFESGVLTSFVEAGWVLGRHVKFSNSAPGFDITSGFIGRFGFSY